MTKKLLVSIAIIACLLVCIGCAKQHSRGHSFHSEALKKNENTKMAILPFDNLSKTEGAAKTMENYVLVELLKYSHLRVAEPGEVAAALLQERVRLATSIDHETLARLGKTLGVNLFVVGVVHEYDMESASGAAGTGQIPVVSITVRVIEANSGDIVWAINLPKRGTDKEKVFGIGRIQSVDRLGQVAAEEVAQSFAASVH